MNGPIDQFRQAMTNAGLTAPDVIHDDGAIHRNGKGMQQALAPAHLLTPGAPGCELTPTGMPAQ